MRISDWSSDVCSSDLVEGLTAAACEEGAFDRAGLMLAMQVWSQSSDVEQKKARRLAEWLAGAAARGVAALDGPCWLFLTQKGEALQKTEERRGGKDGGSTCKTWGEPNQ